MLYMYLCWTLLRMGFLNDLYLGPLCILIEIKFEINTKTNKGSNFDHFRISSVNELSVK